MATMGMVAHGRHSLRARRPVFALHEHPADCAARTLQFHHHETRRSLSLSLSSTCVFDHNHNHNHNHGNAASGGSASQQHGYNYRPVGSSTLSVGLGLRDWRHASTQTAGASSSSPPPDAAPEAPGDAPVKVSMDELLTLASRKPTALSLGDMYRHAPKRRDGDGGAGGGRFVDVDRLRNAQFLHREVPVRIAQRAVDLLTLPRGLSRTREVQAVADTYLRYLAQLRDFPVPTNEETERAFTDLLRGLVLDRHAIPMAIAHGLRSLQDARRAPDARKVAEMEEGLTRFFTVSRNPRETRCGCAVGS